MTTRIDTTIEFRHTQSVGPAMVYVLPHRSDTFLKIGFSRDPLQRMQDLHRRYFEFFDIERAFFIETTHVRDARRVETALKKLVGEHRAPAPLDVRWQAGGDTEWYRGAYDILAHAAKKYEATGHVVNRNVGPWIRTKLKEKTGMLYEWSLPRWQAIADNPNEFHNIEQTLLDTFDAYAAFGLDITEAVPADVAQWYARRRCGEQEHHESR